MNYEKMLINAKRPLNSPAKWKAIEIYNADELRAPYRKY